MSSGWADDTAGGAGAGRGVGEAFEARPLDNMTSAAQTLSLPQAPHNKGRKGDGRGESEVNGLEVF